MEMWQFIRHPSDIPIVVGTQGRLAESMRILNDIGLGGLAFCSDCALECGIVVEFLAQDNAFRARMVERICHIENYRSEIFLTEGWVLTSEEAAIEWIRKFASDFPCLDFSVLH